VCPLDPGSRGNSPSSRAGADLGDDGPQIPMVVAPKVTHGGSHELAPSGKTSSIPLVAKICVFSLEDAYLRFCWPRTKNRCLVWICVCVPWLETV
jgi:hypothetical protein